MSPATPDADRDIIVKHVTGHDPETGTSRDRWLIFLGSAKRGEAEDAQRAMVFARLLADLIKRPVWIFHDPDRFEPFDPSSVRGCSCC
jgi:hypothetical protein